jgi:hemolysin III
LNTFFALRSSGKVALLALHVQARVIRDNDARALPGMKAVDELFAAAQWDQTRREELANSISHGFGLVAAIVATPFLCLAAARQPSQSFYAGTLIFVVTMWVLYLCSTIYHAWPQTRLKCAFQIMDHVAIFFLIAGTYSPFTLGPLRGPLGWTIFGLIWLLAAIGVVFKLRTGIRWKKLSLFLYLGMSWLILVAFRPFVQVVQAETVWWLLAGGVAYTSGLIFFCNKRLPYSHFVWHLFVLTGTACHFCAIFSCVA